MCDIEYFIKELREEFPDEAKLTDDLHKHRGFELEDKAYFIWVEALSDITNQKIKRREKEELRKLLLWVDCQYLQGEEEVRNLIDVSFAETLMYDMEKDDVEWAWSLIPNAIKDLYIRMWGNPIDEN